MKTNISTLRKVLLAFVCMLFAIVMAFAFTACGDTTDNNDEKDQDSVQNGGNTDDGKDNDGDNSDDGNGGDETDGGEAVLEAGTYWGIYEKTGTGMGDMKYTAYFTLDDENGTYTFGTYFVVSMGGNTATYYGEETGTYTDNGTKVTFTPAGKTAIDGTISEDKFTLKRDVSGMGMANYEVTYELGSAPAYVAYEVDGDVYAKVGYKSASDVVVAIEVPEEYEDDYAWVGVPAIAGKGATAILVATDEVATSSELISGRYYVDISWSAMSKSTQPVLTINAGEMEFSLCNDAAGRPSRGAGEITYVNGTYTLKYESGVQTTFVYDVDKDVITFLSPLYSVSSMAIAYNRLDDGVTFVSYTAARTELVGGEYYVDISWSQMAGYMQPVLAIDADTMTFNLFTASASDSSKGSGDVVYVNGVYTLVYDNEDEEDETVLKTTFTFDTETGEITFTSKLYFGTSSFDRTEGEGDDAVFKSYTASIPEENED